MGDILFNTNVAKLIGRLKDSFRRRPPHIPKSVFRYYVASGYAYIAAWIMHIIMIFAFWAIGAPWMSLFNVVSVLIWYWVLVLQLQGKLVHAFHFGAFEVLAHAAACVILVGWDVSFQYYVLLVPVCATQMPLFKLRAKWFYGMASCFIFLWLLASYGDAAPNASLRPSLVSGLQAANIMITFFIIYLISHLYAKTADRMEKALRREKDNVIKVLNERDKALYQLQKELNEAAKYVISALPKPILKGPVRTDWRFIPSSTLGGDSFGYHWADDDHFVVYLLDVSGHGVGAALLSVSIANVLRSRSLPKTDFLEPDQVLTALNHAFPAEENDDMFFTIWYGVYDKSSRKLRYASGGHPPAILYPGDLRDSNKVAKLRTKNMFIGNITDIRFKKDVVQLGKSGRLYVFSDGVFEIRKAEDGKIWTFKEFEDFLAGPETVEQSKMDGLLKHAKTLSQSDSLEDDFSILEVVFD